MNYKSYLYLHYEKLYGIKYLLETTDSNYVDMHIINPKQLDVDTVSIVMTTCNRSTQTYFTLRTISNSVYKNIQIILIDDSTNDFILEEKLEEYDMHIELIRIKNKFWINPCVNYNIGFKYIRGSRVIIQNAEVCHVGDVINYVITNIADNEYHTFDVYSLKGLAENDALYELYECGNMTYDNQQNIILLNGSYVNHPDHQNWYQHPIHRNAYYHFLTAVTKQTLDKIGGFDIDYALGTSWDDDAFIFKIIHSDINLINVVDPIMGVHQWHSQIVYNKPRNFAFKNLHLYKRKCKYYKMNKEFLDLTSYNKNEIVNIIKKWI